MDVAKRLSEFKRKGETDREFAKRIGTLPQNFSSWKNGQYGPGAEMLDRAARLLNVSLAYLLRGTGPRSASIEAVEPARAAARDLRDKLAQIVDEMEREFDLPPRQPRDR